MAPRRMTDDIAFVQGEMADWSDFDSPVAPAGGPVLETLVDQQVPPGAAVLVVGVHTPRLIARILARAGRVVLVLRSRPDALRAAELFSGSQVEVVCGDSSSVRLDERAEVLLALDGLDRAVSAESPLRPWQERFDHLRRQLVPEARMLLTVANPLGLHELAGAVAQLRDDDAAWRSAPRYDPTVPARPAVVAGLAPGSTVLSLLPDVGDPHLAWPVGSAGAGSWNAALCRVHAGPRGGRLDRPTTLDAAIAAGRADDFAAGWVLVVGSEQTNPIALDAPAPPAPSAAGRVLESLLLEASAARDLATVRELFGSVAEQLRGADEDALASLAALLPSEVLVSANGALVPLRKDLATTTPSATPGPDDVLVHWVTDFAARLSQLGWQHPWPEAAGALEVGRLVVASLGLDPDAVLRSPKPLVGHADDDVRVEHVARLERENETLRAKIVWFEQAVRHRDTQLARLRHRQQDPRPRLTRQLAEANNELTMIRASRSYRLGRAVTSPWRIVRSRLRP